MPVRDLQRVRGHHLLGQVLRSVRRQHQAVLLQRLSGRPQEGPQGLLLLPEGHIRWGRLPRSHRRQRPVQGLLRSGVSPEVPGAPLREGRREGDGRLRCLL